LDSFSLLHAIVYRVLTFMGFAFRFEFRFEEFGGMDNGLSAMREGE
jgi:hypothetical protein